MSGALGICSAPYQNAIAAESLKQGWTASRSWSMSVSVAAPCLVFAQIAGREAAKSVAGV